MADSRNRVVFFWPAWPRPACHRAAAAVDPSLIPLRCVSREKKKATRHMLMQTPAAALSCTDWGDTAKNLVSCSPESGSRVHFLFNHNAAQDCARRHLRVGHGSDGGQLTMISERTMS